MEIQLTCFFILVSPLWAAITRNAVNSCSSTEFSCGDGGCVSADLVCDGTRDCADGTDELTCVRSAMYLSSEDPVLHRSRRQSSCRKNQWTCRDGSCISFDGKCDGIVDCPDGSDETHPLCRKTVCQHNWFRCTYGACVDGTAPCNGVKDCADNSDELLPKCRNETDEIRGQFKCLDGTTIPAANHCDGVRDCVDGSDETVRTCAAKSCPSYLFQCAYGACVDSGADCNKVQECADGSDEASELCDKNLTPTTPIKPQRGNCILPPYPAHGTYVTNIPNAKPGDAYDFVTINVTCRQGHGVDGSKSVYCYNGWWPEAIPKCVSQCHLTPHPSVEYRCIVSGEVDGSRACNEYEPAGTVVSPQCRTPNYYSATALKFMRCIDGNWDYIARCSPGLTKNGTNITILIKDAVEVHVSDIQYVVPANNINSSYLPVVPITDSDYNSPSKNGDKYSYTSVHDAITKKPNDNSNCNTIIDANKNDATDTKIDESDYEIDDLDWRMGVPSTSNVKYTTPSYTKNSNTKNMTIDSENKTYSTKNNRTHIYFNISNSSVNIYTDERFNLRNYKTKSPAPLRKCGTATPDGAQLVLGGESAKRGEVPWHAGIYTKTKNPYQQICGGSLISTNIVISAAHCFWSNIEGQQPASNYAVAVGKLYRPWGNSMEEAQRSDVKELRLPVRFQGSAANYQDDIAIVIVTEAFVYKTFIRPVCVDFDINFERRQLQPGKKGKVAGWGLTAENGVASQILKVIDLPYVSIETCIAESPAGFREYITSDKICAGYIDAGSALCKGDSGGGLAFPESDKGTPRYYLRGIVSTAPNNENLCNANTYTSFTQILKHEHFIKQFWGADL